MKTIKLIVRVSGYLKEGDTKSFDLDDSEVSVECVNKLDEAALAFLHGSFLHTAYDALSKYYKKEEDYIHES